METEGGPQLFEAEKGGVMKNGPLKGGGPCKYMPVIMQRFTHRTKREFFIWFKKKKQERKKKTRTTEHYGYKL